MNSPTLRVLIAQHRWWFPTAVSGADLANQEFARKLKERGVEVRVFGVSLPSHSVRTDNHRYSVEGVPVCLVTSDFVRQLRLEIKSFKPDVVLTACPEPSAGADDITRMIEVFTRFKLPVVLYVHELEETLPLFSQVKDQLAQVVTNSRFMADRINKLWSVDCEVVYPVPDWESIDARSRAGPFITFFNPIPRKGFEIAHTLVTVRFKDRPFLFVEGFIDSEAHGISLVRSGNLVHARSSPDVATIYAMTRLLIIPSQWEEPFGRVAIEGMYNRIPVIASNTGGLFESVGDGGILIDDFKDIDHWVDAITQLDEPKARRRVVEAGKKHVKQFSLDREIDKLLDILKRFSA